MSAKATVAPLVHPNLAAFLDMIAWSEGTDNGRQATNDRGYDVLVGGGLFSGYEAHPNKLVPLPRLGIKSTAAGRYQLLHRYWLAYTKQLGLRGFDPLVQDRIAIQQIKERGAIKLIEAGDFQGAVFKVKNIWASLPGAGYGQHEQKLDRLAVAYTAAGGVFA